MVSWAEAPLVETLDGLIAAIALARGAVNASAVSLDS
jgi:hypothetical protein